MFQRNKTVAGDLRWEEWHAKETMTNKTEEKNRKRLLYFLNIKTSKPPHKYSLKSFF